MQDTLHPDIDLAAAADAGEPRGRILAAARGAVGRSDGKLMVAGIEAYLESLGVK